MSINRPGTDSTREAVSQSGSNSETEPGGVSHPTQVDEDGDSNDEEHAEATADVEVAVPGAFHADLTITASTTSMAPRLGLPSTAGGYFTFAGSAGGDLGGIDRGTEWHAAFTSSSLTGSANYDNTLCAGTWASGRVYNSSLTLSAGSGITGMFRGQAITSIAMQLWSNWEIVGGTWTMQIYAGSLKINGQDVATTTQGAGEGAVSAKGFANTELGPVGMPAGYCLLQEEAGFYITGAIAIAGNGVAGEPSGLGPPQDCSGSQRSTCQAWIALVLAQPPVVSSTTEELNEVPERLDGIVDIRGTTKCYKGRLRTEWGMEFAPIYYQTLMWTETVLEWCTDLIRGESPDLGLRETTGSFALQDSWVWPPWASVLTIYEDGAIESCGSYYSIEPYENRCAAEETYSWFHFEYLPPIIVGGLRLCQEHHLLGNAYGERWKTWRWAWPDCGPRPQNAQELS